ncbi:roundabout homolog 4 isoform X1 [Lepisosteus oculatus]|uniref:roundabout homolog 4 isoform X1 n=1 Tax=Lepisosteus oculatus TaxID=7918 RepID=UPI003722CF94
MHIGVLLVWVTSLCTWAESSRQCQCQCTCLPQLAPARGSRTQDRERLRQRPAQPFLRSRLRAHGRKGSRLHSEDTVPQIVHHPSDVVVQVDSPASLSCRAEGHPEPTIEWYRNGVPVETSRPAGQSHPIILPDGSLFFLRVTPGRRGHSDEGVYACVARNSLGLATSRNATLHIAALREEFRTQPSDVEVAVGEPAVLNCTPPRGHPEPNVTWKKDGTLIDRMDERYSILNGRLVIPHAQKNDSGVYICVATNTVGVRESRAGRLTVLERPIFTQKPQDVTAMVGGSVQFTCRVQGDPMPAVHWSRDQGLLPYGRYVVNSDHSLQIHYVTAQDAGRYTCIAANEVGSSSSSAVLSVQEALDTGQKELHRELSSVRVDLESVAVQPASSNMVLLYWKAQLTPPQPHYLDGYGVLYRPLLPASSDWVEKRVALETSAVIGPLKRGYKYEFKVRPHGGGLYGRESNSRHLWIPEEVPSAPPQRISVMLAVGRNDTAQVSWEPPPHEAHNGIIRGYQVWCSFSVGHQSSNWTVDSGTHSLEMGSLEPGTQYWIRVAALNGAGVGVPSEPHSLFIEPQEALTSKPPSQTAMEQVLGVVRGPIFIGSAGALLWVALMGSVVCLYRRHSRNTELKHAHRQAAGLYRLASEDLIIKHRMAVPDSPWISSAWKSAPCSERYPGLWAQSQENPGFRKTTLPLKGTKKPCPQETAVPIVPDSCGLYGTFYVDLSGAGLKTFNSPARCTKIPHCSPKVSDPIRFSQPVFNTSASRDTQVLPWKQALPVQPNMGVLKESWEKNYKRELHAVNSAPLVSTSQQSGALRSVPTSNLQRLTDHPRGALPECPKLAGSPRVLHYSASLRLIDMLPALPPLPQTDHDTHSLSSEEESSRSTRLTVDGGSVRSIGDTSRTPAAVTADCPSHPSLSYSRLSTASFCLSVDEETDGALTHQEVARYLELSPKVKRHRALAESPTSPPRPFSPTPTFGYICGPLPSDLEAEDVSEDLDLDLAGSRQLCPRGGVPRRCHTPSSCGSEWEGSLWNGWGSVSGGNTPSARASLLSSSDGSFMNDANFARVLAVAAETLGGSSFSDFSPPASPLSGLPPPYEACFGERAPLPAWDWSTAWMEEMEAQYGAPRGWGERLGAAVPEPRGPPQDSGKEAEGKGG